MSRNVRYLACWVGHAPPTADQDDGPDWRAAKYESLPVAMFAARYHAARGPKPECWEVVELRLRYGRSLLRQDQWVPTGRVLRGDCSATASSEAANA